MSVEDLFVGALIDCVKQRPLLYDVRLADYKNKNKKGEAFKEIQVELRQAGFEESEGQNLANIGRIISSGFSAGGVQEVDIAEAEISCGVR